jgi:hypothetical protein
MHAEEVLRNLSPKKLLAEEDKNPGTIPQEELIWARQKIYNGSPIVILNDPKATSVRLLYYNTPILLYYNTTVLLYYNTTILLYYNTTVLLYYYTAVLLFYYTTILLCTITLLHAVLRRCSRRRLRRGYVT